MLPQRLARRRQTGDSMARESLPSGWIYSSVICLLITVWASAASAQQTDSGPKLARAVDTVRTAPDFRESPSSIGPTTSVQSAVSLVPSLDAPALDIVLDSNRSVTRFPTSYQAVVASTPGGTDLLSHQMLPTPETSPITGDLGHSARRIAHDTFRTFQRLKRLSRTVMRGARLFGPTLESPGAQTPIEARVSPGWKRGSPIARFDIRF